MPSISVSGTDYTFTAADGGFRDFTNLVLSQPGEYTLTGMDTADPTISGSVTFTIAGP